MTSPSTAAVGSFQDLALTDTMRRALDLAGYQVPTPIQAGLIPLAMAGRDVVGQARTGTGKTAAFAIPIIERQESRKTRGVDALVLVPTRELAVQVRDEFRKLAQGRRATCVAIYGGKPIREQIERLRKGAPIVVGTPGRVLDHIGRQTIHLGELRWVVLDEADRMLDIGFRPDIEKILRRCPRERQTLLLSATVPPPIQRLAERYMQSPERLDFSPDDITVETIDQFYFTVDPKRKLELLVRILERDQPRQAIIFCRTKRGTESLGQRLAKRFPQVGCMQGDMEQRQRDRAMEDFRSLRVRYLVATDVVGRGIDVSGISHIINYDIPTFSDDYIHRVGRTGRMGREGVAYTFVSPEEGIELTRIEQRINRQLVRDEIPGFQACAPAEPAPDLPPPPQPPPPPPSALRRPPRRHRRAL